MKWKIYSHKFYYFKSTRKKSYFKISEEQNLRKVTESLYIFLTSPDEVEKYAALMQSNSSDKYVYRFSIEILNLFDPELQLINTKPMIKNKLKELLSDLKKFKVQKILVSDYKKRNNRKIFHSSAKLIASDSDIDKELIFLHQSIMTKMENYASEDSKKTEIISTLQWFYRLLLFLFLVNITNNSYANSSLC